MWGKPSLIFVERRKQAIPNLRPRHDIELVNTLFVRDAADRPARKHNKQWNQNRTRPVRYRIDAEVKPLRQKHDSGGMLGIPCQSYWSNNASAIFVNTF